MPIYEYQCEACGHQLEALQKISDAALTDCPACGQSALRKRISAVGFRLKGGGWYETDFKKSERRRNIAGEGAASDGGGKEKTAAAGDGGSAPAAGSASTPAASTGGKS